MHEVRTPETLQFSRRIGVETPEHVLLEFELAGLGSRAAAAVVDTVLLAILLFLLTLVFFATLGLTDALAGWAVAVWIALGFALAWGYFVLFEALGVGRTPGKRLLGIRVVMDTGHPITFPAAAIRNLVRLVDSQPAPTHLVALIVALFHREHKRLGDMVAGSIVVRDRAEDIVIAPTGTAEDTVLDAGPPRLSEDEFRLLEGFSQRLDSLIPDARIRLSTQLVNRFADRFPEREPDPDAFLVRLYDEELTRRRSRTAARGERGIVRASGTAERFVAMRQDVWEKFRREAAKVAQGGIGKLPGSAVRRFAADYREVAADLARARTYGVDRRVLDYLERIVSAGHNALYGLRGVRRHSVRRLLLADFPAAVVRARHYVAGAALLFTIPAFVGFFLIRGQPELAYEVLPHSAIERAESGASELEQGRGYAETPPMFLPAMASGIVANNVQVAFAAFAFGITAGIGTVFVLVFNGLFFGAILGLFTNYGLTAWLLTFVAGHGVLELSAIFIAGGAGLIVGRAVIAPGDLTRRDSLVVHGRGAIHLVGAAASLLLLAGTIEGFLSASAAPAAVKLGVSAATALLLLLYFEAGRRQNTAASLSPQRNDPGRPPPRFTTTVSEL